MLDLKLCAYSKEKVPCSIHPFMHSIFPGHILVKGECVLSCSFGDLIAKDHFTLQSSNPCCFNSQSKMPITIVGSVGFTCHS